MRWNAVLVILGVLLVLDALLILSKDLKFDALSRDSMIPGADVLPPRKHQKRDSPRRDPPPLSEGIAADRKGKLESQEEKSETGASYQHKVAGLNCDAYGGPSEEDAKEMVYWQDIPSDATYVSPLKAAGPEIKYLTFEPDEGEWDDHCHFLTFPFGSL